MFDAIRLNLIDAKIPLQISSIQLLMSLSIFEQGTQP